MGKQKKSVHEHNPNDRNRTEENLRIQPENPNKTFKKMDPFELYTFKDAIDHKTGFTRIQP